MFPLKQEPCEVFFAYSKDDIAQSRQTHTTLSVNVGKQSLYLIKVMLHVGMAHLLLQAPRLELFRSKRLF